MSGSVPRVAGNSQALCDETAIRRTTGAAGGDSVMVFETLFRGASESGAGLERIVRVEGSVHTGGITGMDTEQHVQKESEDRAAGRRETVDDVESARNRQQAARRSFLGFLRAREMGMCFALYGWFPAARR